MPQRAGVWRLFEARQLSGVLWCPSAIPVEMPWDARILTGCGKSGGMSRHASCALRPPDDQNPQLSREATLGQSTLLKSIEFPDGAASSHRNRPYTLWILPSSLH
jgi:hypothetical protein